MNKKESSSIVWFALQFELALAMIGYAAGWLTGTPPQWVLVARPDGWRHLASSLVMGAAVAMVLILLLWISQNLPLKPLRDLRQLVDQLLVPLFIRASWWQLALVSLAAGVGEEILFRAWLQTALERWWQGPGSEELALIVASITFGLCHWLSATYAVLATLIGLVMGWLFRSSGHIAAPIAAHALYDFLAFVYLLNTHKATLRHARPAEATQGEEP